MLTDEVLVVVMIITVPHGPLKVDGRVHPVGHSLRVRPVHPPHTPGLRHTELLQQVEALKQKKDT